MLAMHNIGNRFIGLGIYEVNRLIANKRKIRKEDLQVTLFARDLPMKKRHFMAKSTKTRVLFSEIIFAWKKQLIRNFSTLAEQVFDIFPGKTFHKTAVVGNEVGCQRSFLFL